MIVHFDTGYANEEKNKKKNRKKRDLFI